MVEIRTSLGNIKVELYPDKAPLTVKNFLIYVKKKSYDGTIFHRVVAGFIIQGGGFDKNLKKRSTGEPIKNEANNGLNNKRGTIAMARTHIVDSATNQFFINLNDNYSLDHKYLDQAGYCVFGKVIAGMDVVDKIGKVKTNWKKRRKDVPVEDIIIKEIVKVN
jgi:cyclophilin family peptidyl-prolyl cis-trans isomerase